MNITFDIDPAKINKDYVRVTRSQKRLFDFRLVKNKDGKDDYGNDGFVAQVVPKDKRADGVKGPIVGNWKDWGAQEQRRPAPPAQAPKAQDDNGSDDVPF